MPPETIHVVQAFKQTDEGVTAIEPKRFQSAGVAKAAARILAHTHCGVIAWSLSADPTTGEFREQEELLRLGDLPDWFDRPDGLADFEVQRAQAA